MFVFSFAKTVYSNRCSSSSSLSFSFQRITRNDTLNDTLTVFYANLQGFPPAKINKPVALYVMFSHAQNCTGARQFPRALSFRLLRRNEHSQEVSLNGFHIEEGLCPHVCEFTQHDEPLALFYLISFQFLACFVSQTEVLVAFSARAPAFHYILGTSIRET